jgi:hypothetical protein
MQTIIIKPKDKKELTLLYEMLKKMDIKSQILNEDEQEDLTIGKGKKEGIKLKRNLPISESKKRKQKLLSEIETGLKEVKLIQEGKIKKKSLKEMLHGK